jgi:hypothetical protein
MKSNLSVPGAVGEPDTALKSIRIQKGWSHV